MRLGELKALLSEFRFKDIFLALNYGATSRRPFDQTIGQTTFTITPLAELGGFYVLEAVIKGSDALPSRDKCVALDAHISPIYTENLIIFVNESRTESYFQKAITVKKHRIPRGHRHLKGAPAAPLARTLLRLKIPFEVFDDLGSVSILEVTDRVERSGLFADRVTDRFFEKFRELRGDMLKFLGWIQDESRRDWYCSVLLNRLMFIYFISERGLVPGGRSFLRDQMTINHRSNGADTFYTHLLLPLSFFGLGEKQGSRGRFEKMFEGVVYLNGGLFAVHTIERDLGIDKQTVSDAQFGELITIPDAEFLRWFDYFDKWQWTLDEDNVENDDYISPHILGYIFERYINDRSKVGAYYTKDDVTSYICRNAIIPRLLDMLSACSEQGRKSVDPLPIGPHPNLLNDGKGISQGEGIDRYVYQSVKTADYLALEAEDEFSSRQQSYQEILTKFEQGKVCSADDFIANNLDLQLLAKDFVENIQDPQVLHDFYFKGLQRISVLDPTCGSGAFLLAALNTLHPLYEAALKRMRYVIGKATGEEPDVVNWRGELHFDDLLGTQGVLFDRAESRIIERMRDEVDRINQHPSPEYFVKKSVIVNNLFGVDMMEEAVEICKLRLFLTLIATADKIDDEPNYGIEPLPDIDFNVLAGNSLVGFESIADIDRLWDFASISRGDEIGSLLAIDRNHDALRRDLDVYADIIDRHQESQLDQQADSRSEKDRVLRAGALLRRPLDLDLFDLYAKVGLVDGKRTTAHGADSRFPSWKRSHQPFHWLLEFPKAEARGGFDVIVGNPPYVELKDVTGYRILGFDTKSCADLYALVTERAMRQVKPLGRVAMIVPISIFNTDGFVPLQRFVIDRSEKLWVSTYSNRPAQLFDGAQKRLTIFISKRVASDAVSAEIYTSGYERWFKSERGNLMQRVSYIKRGSDIFAVVPGSLEKLGSREEVDLFSKLVSRPGSVADCLSAEGRFHVYYTRKFSYFLAFTDFIPEIRTIDGNKLVPPTELKLLSLKTDEARYALIATLSSSLFFWFWNVISDVRNVNRRDLLSFPLNLESLDADSLQGLAVLGREYASKLASTSKTMTKSGKKIQSLQPADLKTLIDSIDAFLGRIFGLSSAEVGMIQGYHLKYRSGVVGSNGTSANTTPVLPGVLD